MPHIVLLLAFMLSTLLLAGCDNGEATGTKKFHNDITLPTTPVKQQGNSQLCWVYAMLATIETEHIVQGDSVDLSPSYMARMLLHESAMRYCANPKGNISTRGMIARVPRLLECHGAMPYTSYRVPENINVVALVRKLQTKAQAAYTRRTGLAKLSHEIGQLLDDEMAPTAESVFMNGCSYTPVEFAHSVMRHEEYAALTSFTHHPWGCRFAIEVPDNTCGDTFLNVPLDSMMAYIDRALHTGHPVCWEGDVSEPGFRHAEGYATLHDESTQVSQAYRQEAFDLRKTTDDHCMEIVGMAHDDEGHKYYICKNSWGRGNRYGGYMYLSENYVRAKTIAIMLSSSALPEMDRMLTGDVTKTFDGFSENPSPD